MRQAWIARSAQYTSCSRLQLPASIQVLQCLQALAGAEVAVSIPRDVSPPAGLNPGVVCGVVTGLQRPPASASSQASPLGQMHARVLVVDADRSACSMLTQEVDMPCSWLRRLADIPAPGFVAASEPAVQV